MSTPPYTPESPAQEVFAALAGLARQAITELDEDSFTALCEDLTSVSAQLLHEHLWRVGTRVLPFPLDGDNNRHEGVSLTLRELADEVHHDQQTVLYRHLHNIQSETERQRLILLIDTGWTTRVLTNSLTSEQLSWFCFISRVLQRIDGQSSF